MAAGEAMNKKIPVFAVIRVDLDVGSPEDAVTVKEILPGADEAAVEVERLNRLNAPKKARYFFQATRYFPDGRKASGRKESRLKVVR
jgi:hypothetical protein